jgi:hypothetical protein
MKKYILFLLAVFLLAGCSDTSVIADQIALEQETIQNWENVRKDMEGRITDFDKLNSALNTQLDLCMGNVSSCFVYLGEEFDPNTNESTYIEASEDDEFVSHYFAYGPGGGSSAIFRKPTTESSEYVVVFEGQSSPSCNLVEELNISTVVSGNCEREDGNLFDRVNNEVIKFE